MSSGRVEDEEESYKRLDVNTVSTEGRDRQSISPFRRTTGRPELSNPILGEGFRRFSQSDRFYFIRLSSNNTSENSQTKTRR